MVVFCHERYLRIFLMARHGGTRPLPLALPWPRFSAALPLGINGAARHSKAGWNYPKQPTASTLLVLLRLAEPRGPKPPAAEARNVAELVSGHAGSDPQSLIHYLFSKAGRTPGRNGNSQRASGVLRAARGEAFSPRDPKGRKSSVAGSWESPKPQMCAHRVFG